MANARRTPRKKQTDAAPRRAKRPQPGRASGQQRREPAREVEAVASEPFRLGAIPGATPGKWIDVWQERRTAQPLELVALEVAEQRDALIDGTVDAALVRLPIERDGLSVIALYDELPVVVMSADSHLTATDELDAADLVGEVLVVPLDDVLAVDIAGTVAPRFDAPRATADAVATVAAGVGVVIVPMSLARLHHRKDADYRVLRDGPTSTVALAWPTDRTTPSVEAFIGIVRGRTANSSRG